MCPDSNEESERQEIHRSNQVIQYDEYYDEDDENTTSDDDSNDFPARNTTRNTTRTQAQDGQRQVVQDQADYPTIQYTTEHPIQSDHPEDAAPAREKEPLQTQVTANLPERRPTELSRSNPEPGVMPEIPYYYGLDGGISLIASTISNAGTHSWPRDSIDSGFFAKKRLFALRNHNIVKKWETDIFASIMRIRSKNSPESWVSVHCVRIGFKTIPEENPVVILVIVKPESIKSIDGESLVQEVKAMCANEQITDVEVELAYSPKIKSMAGEEPHILEGPFEADKVLVGASIGPPTKQTGFATKSSAGALAAFLSAKDKNGVDVLLALTNDHVCFNDSRELQESDRLEKRSFRYEDKERIYTMFTPSSLDYDGAKKDFKEKFELETSSYKESKDKLKDRPEKLCSIKKALDDAEAKYTTFTKAYPNEPTLLGYVYGTGGARVRSGMPMDWGVIKVTDNARFAKCHRKLNQLPDLNFYYPKTEDEIRKKLIKFVPHLDIPVDGSIPGQISKLRTSPPQEGEIFFKVGRTTKWTAGEFNICKSIAFNSGMHAESHHQEDYDWNNGACLMWCFIGVGGKFADSGDSGSLVFDIRGEAIGLFLGEGAFEQVVSLVASLDTVFRDIELHLELNNIRFAHMLAEGKDQDFVKVVRNLV